MLWNSCPIYRICNSYPIILYGYINLVLSIESVTHTLLSCMVMKSCPINRICNFHLIILYGYVILSYLSNFNSHHIILYGYEILSYLSNLKLPPYYLVWLWYLVLSIESVAHTLLSCMVMKSCPICWICNSHPIILNGYEILSYLSNLNRPPYYLVWLWNIVQSIESVAHTLLSWMVMKSCPIYQIWNSHLIILYGYEILSYLLNL